MTCKIFSCKLSAYTVSIRYFCFLSVSQIRDFRFVLHGKDGKGGINSLTVDVSLQPMWGRREENVIGRRLSTTNRVRISVSRRMECLMRTLSLPPMRMSWIESASNLPSPFKASDSWITGFRLNYHSAVPSISPRAARNIDQSYVKLCARFLDFRSVRPEWLLLERKICETCARTLCCVCVCVWSGINLRNSKYTW